MYKVVSFTTLMPNTFVSKLIGSPLVPGSVGCGNETGSVAETDIQIDEIRRRTRKRN